MADLGRGENVRALRLDVTDPASISAAIGSAAAEAGRLDALVNNAGYGQYGAVEDVPAEEWRAQFEVNVFGAVAMIRAVLPEMRAGGGTIVNVSSVAGRIAIPFAAPYCASKHALEAISDALRVEVAPFHVRVVLVEPGPIATKFGDRARASVERFSRGPGPVFRVLPGTPSARWTRTFQAGRLPPERVARVIVDAIESPRPKTRYNITRMARTFIPLKRVLTDRMLDRQMRRSLGIKKNIKKK